MKLDPARGGGDGLSSVFRPPAFNKAHPDRTHSCQLVHRFESLTDALRQQRREFLIIKDLEITAGWYFADGGGVPAVTLVAVGRLNEDGRLGEAFGEHLSSDVVETDAASDVPPRHLYRTRPVDVRKKAETESLGV